MNKRIRLILMSIMSFMLVFSTISTTVTAAYPITATVTTYNGQPAVLYQQYQNRASGVALISKYYVGGTLAWRNNNPGNMVYGDFTKANGAIAEGGRSFAIFPDYNTGYAAMKTKVTVDYKNKTIRELITIWAPPSENDTEAYIKFVVQQLGSGVTESTKVSSLTST